MKMNAPFLALLLLATLVMAGCQGNIIGSQGRVSIVDSAERVPLDQNKIDLSDIIAFAEDLTNQMLASPIFSRAARPPRLVLGRVVNNTHDENLRVADIYGRIQQVLLNSGQARILDPTANSFDYIVTPEIFSIRTGDGSRRKVDYSMIMKLYTLQGELKGQWAGDLSKFRAR